MKFLQKERAKLGSAPGTIIQWSSPVNDNDPNAANNVDVLPAGYLRCDGSVYSSRQYPYLARILGTGAGSLYKKDDQFLDDDQFQVPDLGSKHIESSVGANVGSYRNSTKITGTDTVIQKAGVGVEINSNIGDVAQVGFNGTFTVPSQNFALNGNVGWTFPTTTEEETVQERAIGPHMHYSGTRRVAVKESPGFGNTSRPYYQRPEDATTASPDCNDVAAAYFSRVGSEPGYCNSTCENFQEAFIGRGPTGGGPEGQPAENNQSQWPTSKTITTITAANWPNNATINVGNLRPFDTVPEDSSIAYATIRNTEQTVEAPPGTDTTDFTLHSHRLDRDFTETDYEATTDVGSIRPDGLSAEVSVRTSSSTKFDDVVSPFIVVEFLIKY
jgi:hypothetical protein